MQNLPPNNGAPQVLNFERVRTEMVRDSIARGVFPELEYGLLKGTPMDNTSRSGNDEVLGWGIDDKAVLLNLEIDTIKATQGTQEVEVEVRSLCYSRGVTADYLENYERYNMKQCVLVLGNLGKSRAPWADLIQPAVYLHRKEFNIIWIDVPQWYGNSHLWLKYGSVLLSGVIRFLRIEKVSVLARGIGGVVFLNALAKKPQMFGKTHFVFNIDQPAKKGSFVNIMDLEEVLRAETIQLWFGFKDDDTYDRRSDGSPQKANDVVSKLSTRLSAERQRMTLIQSMMKPYDEVLISDNLMHNATEMKIGINTILAWSRKALDAIAIYLELEPGTRQESLVNGLIGDFRSLSQADELQKDNEPLALRRERIGAITEIREEMTPRCHRNQCRHKLSPGRTHRLTYLCNSGEHCYANAHTRRLQAQANKDRLSLMRSAVKVLPRQVPALRDFTPADLVSSLSRRLHDEVRGNEVRRSTSSGSLRRTVSEVTSKRSADSKRSSRCTSKDLGQSVSLPSLMAPKTDEEDGDSSDDGLLGVLCERTESADVQQQYRKEWEDFHGKWKAAFSDIGVDF